MTRFARRNGVAEKKETKMKKEEATSWEKMFDDQKADDKQQHQSEDEETNEERKRKHESLSILEKKIEEDNLNNEMNKANKKLKTNDRKSSIMNEFGKYIDKEVLDDLDKMLAKKRISYEEYLESLLREGRSNRRRLDRQKERESNRVCFKCRKSGHMVSDCPESKQDSEAATGICYKCGSTEHSVNNCKVKVEAGSYPYAKCFICKEMGHISKQCPDNPRGLYPNGGCCRNCGSVEHYFRDCPEIQKQNLMAEAKTIRKIKPKENVDELSDEEKTPKNNSNVKKTKKMIVFK